MSAKAIVTTGLVAETARLQGLGGLAAAALGRALTCTLLVADGLKDDETFQVNFRGDGPLRGVLALANGRLEARGYVGNPAGASAGLSIRPRLSRFSLSRCGSASRLSVCCLLSPCNGRWIDLRAVPQSSAPAKPSRGASALPS